MNSVEHAIFTGIAAAHNYYFRVADDWFFHAPESFVQHEIARSIVRRTNHSAMAEMSPKRIAAQFLNVPRGRKPKSSRIRFDLVIWRKSNVRLRAVVEIKRAFHFSKIEEDAFKIERYLTLKGTADHGYLIVYSESVGDQRNTRERKLYERMKTWSEKLVHRRWRQLPPHIVSPRDCEDLHGKKWSWGVCIFRLDRRSA